MRRDRIDSQGYWWKRQCLPRSERAHWKGNGLPGLSRLFVSSPKRSWFLAPGFSQAGAKEL